jgi:hypothetical protein
MAASPAEVAKATQKLAKATAKSPLSTQLLTAENVRKLPPLYAQDGKGEDAIAYVKFFGSGRWTWFATEASAVERRFGEVVEVPLTEVEDASQILDVRFFGKVVSGLGADCDELAYFSLVDLASVQFPPFGLAVERDLYFDPVPLRDAS